MFFGFKHDNISGLITEELLPCFPVPLGPMDTNTFMHHPIDEEEENIDLNIPVKKRSGKRKEPTNPEDRYMKKYGPPGNRKSPLSVDDLDNVYMKDPFKMVDIPPPTNGEQLNDMEDSIYDLQKEVDECCGMHEVELIKSIKKDIHLVPKLKADGYYCSSIDNLIISKAQYILLKQSHINMHQTSRNTLNNWYSGHIGKLTCDQCCRIIDMWPASHKIDCSVKWCPYCNHSKRGKELLKMVNDKSAEEKLHLGLSHHTTQYNLHYCEKL